MIEEIVLATIVDGVFGNVLEQSGVADKLKEKFKLDPIRRAFEHALRQTGEWFTKQYPEWTDSLFNGFFKEPKGQQILAQFLTPDGRPSPSNVAVQWADYLALNTSDRRASYARDLEPVAGDLLNKLAHMLKAERDLAELSDSRAFDSTARDVQALRHKLDADEATTGTRRDYLHWLVDDNLYLDPRGTHTTQRVAVKLEDVYVSLRAERDETFSEADRLLREREISELDKKLEYAGFSAEEIEEQHDSLLDSWHRRALKENIEEKPIDLAEMVKRHDRVVILGDPGSGKSTLLRYLALSHAQSLMTGEPVGQRFPIFIRIAQYVQEGHWKTQPLSDFLPDYYRLRECPHCGLANLLEKELAGGNCLVMLDGLDEIVSADERRGVAGRIDDFVQRYHEAGNRFIVTSRKAGYRNAPLGGAFSHYTLQDMDDEQIQGFLKQWCLAVEKAQTPDKSAQVCQEAAQQEIDGILKAINTNTGVRRMAGNPLLLRNLALIHRDQPNLPEKRIELYKRVADTLAHDWRVTQGVPETALVKPESLNPMLGELAFWIHECKPTGLATENEVYEMLGHAWERLNDDEDETEQRIVALKPETVIEVRNFLERVRQHTGLFVERAPKRYGFMHQTFQEYYAALFLATRRGVERAKKIRLRLHDPRWQEVLLLAIGYVGLDYHQDEATALIQTAVLAEGPEAQSYEFTPSEDEDLLGRDFLFALRCLADQVNVRPKLTRRLVGQVVDELTYRKGRARFEKYIWKLTGTTKLMKEDRVAKELSGQLLERLNYPNAQVRSNIADALGRLDMAKPEVMEALLTALGDPEAEVRSKAASALGRAWLITPAIVKALQKTMDDNDMQVRSNSALALGRSWLVTPEVVEALTKALDDPEMQVRSSAVSALGNIWKPIPEVVKGLLKALCDTKPDVRSDAVFYLRSQKPVTPEIAEAMVRMLDESDAQVSASIRFSLGKLGSTMPEIVLALLKACSNPAIQVRENAVLTLGELRTTTPEVMNTLLNVLRDREPLIRSGAARAVGELGIASQQVVNAIITAMLSDPDVSVRSYAAYAIGNLKPAMPEMIQDLFRALGDPEMSVRFRVAYAFGEMGIVTPEVVQALTNMLDDPDHHISYCAALSLSKLGSLSSNLRPILIEALRDAAQFSLRVEAATLIGRYYLDDSEAQAALCWGLLDRTAFVREECVKSLAYYGHQSGNNRCAIEKLFRQAIDNPEFEKTDEIRDPSAQEYAYDGLWLLMVDNGRKD